MLSQSLESTLEILLKSLEKKNNFFYINKSNDLVSTLEYEYLANSNERKKTDISRINNLIQEITKISEIYSKEHSTRKKEIEKLYSIKTEKKYEYLRNRGKELNDSLDFNRIEQIKKNTEIEFNKIENIIKNHPLLRNTDKKKLQYKLNNSKTFKEPENMFFDIKKNEFYRRHLLENYDFLTKEIERKIQTLNSTKNRLNNPKNINLISLKTIEKGIDNYNKTVNKFDVDYNFNKLIETINYLSEINIKKERPLIISNKDLQINNSQIEKEIRLRTNIKEEIIEFKKEINKYNKNITEITSEIKSMHDWQFKIYESIDSIENNTLKGAKRKIHNVEQECEKYIKNLLELDKKYIEIKQKSNILNNKKSRLENICLEHEFNLRIIENISEVESIDNLRLDNTLIRYKEINEIIERKILTEKEIYRKKEEIKHMKKSIGEIQKIYANKIKNYISKNRIEILPLTLVTAMFMSAGLSSIDRHITTNKELKEKYSFEYREIDISNYYFEKHIQINIEDLGKIKLGDIQINNIIDLQRILLKKDLDLISEISDVYSQHQNYIEYFRNKNIDINIDNTLFPEIIYHSSLESARGKITNKFSTTLRDLILFEKKEFPSGHDDFFELIPYFYFKGLVEGIDPAFAYGVNLHETGNNTSNLTRTRNNLFGIKDVGTNYPREVEVMSSAMKRKKPDPHQWYVDKISSINDFYNIISMQYVPRGQDTVVTIGRGINATYERNRTMPFAYAENNRPWINNVAYIRYKISHVRDANYEEGLNLDF